MPSVRTVPNRNYNVPTIYEYAYGLKITAARPSNVLVGNDYCCVGSFCAITISERYRTIYCIVDRSSHRKSFIVGPSGRVHLPSYIRQDIVLKSD